MNGIPGWIELEDYDSECMLRMADGREEPAYSGAFGRTTHRYRKQVRK